MFKGLYDKFADWYRDCAVYLYADPHFGDDEMAFLRKDYIGDDEQIKRINSKVTNRDTLIILGDVGDVKKVKELRGYKVLIKGNHDAGDEKYQRRMHMIKEFNNEEEAKEAVRNGSIDFYQVQNTPPFVVGYRDNKLFDEVYRGILTISHDIVLSHEPFDSRFALNIHGHDHSMEYFVDDMHINLCAEHIEYTPVSLKDIMNSGSLKYIPDIHRVTIDNAVARKAEEK